MYDAAVLIGRFQPVHNGHLALLREALAQARQAVVVVGSAFQARTPKNPFTWQERAQMLRAALPEPERARLTVLPMRDYYDEPRWAEAVRQAVAQATPARARLALVGHFKDSSSGYLRAFPGWDLIRMERQGAIDATAIRDAYLGASASTPEAALAPWAPHIPAATRAWLEQFAHTAHYPALQEEWRMLRAYRDSWACAPYPPVFVTVDALLRCQGRVLLIRRAHAPGKGLWALPGGFVEPHDTLWQSCLRELAEETHCPLPEERLRQALRAVRVFDHPERSQRGRVITHAYFFDLDNDALPEVRGGDDAAHAQWVAQEQLAGMEDQFHDDHWHIIGQLLGQPAASTPAADALQRQTP
ncbi:bifunctional nicotinamide-nucleotide adenylyltransferase/Nudix hydroxylase [Alicycliphilus denitrificans]|uniref:NUDIX domain-containing protein n=1 Tax=Alicycliphilus denitrificans TaxID=179636 RepID=A0A3R7LGG6_9BURK|nr:bifunctional nicotinamide-nucleotide adenylyltransferase/Nudix hydroxylase [Alicycliphilus denitrificans]RKJ98492.1 NUDIX domain-containing protein [Alicycliphilus denitrificans]